MSDHLFFPVQCLSSLVYTCMAFIFITVCSDSAERGFYALLSILGWFCLFHLCSLFIYLCRRCVSAFHIGFFNINQNYVFDICTRVQNKISNKLGVIFFIFIRNGEQKNKTLIFHTTQENTRRMLFSKTFDPSFLKF